MKTPPGPFILPRFESPTGGVDFLGLRQVNLALAFNLLPGINNVTTYVRPYSVLSWIFWKFQALLAQAGRAEYRLSERQAFQDKVETLFTWGHVLKNIGRIPGTDAKPPSLISGKATLRFEDWGRSRENTSLFAPVQYGPSSKTVGGLGFLNPVGGGGFQTCGTGVALAEALDAELRKSRAYRLVNTLAEVRASPSEAADLQDAWTIEKPSQRERNALRQAFFDSSVIGTDSDLGRRSATLSLAMNVLARSRDALDVKSVREAMVYRKVGKRNIELGAPLLRTWYRWAVLQVRQTQRIALEALLAWTEWQIIARGLRTTDAIVSAALQELDRKDNPMPKVKSVRAALSSVFVGAGDAYAALLTGIENEASSIFELRYRLQDSVRGECNSALALALRALSVCARLGEMFDLETEARSPVSSGGPERISIRHWAQTVRRLQDQSMQRVLLYIIENCVLSQHFAIAISRFDGETQRLRISIEEEGLCPLVAEPWIPVVSPDRLDAALWLAADCGLVRCNPEQGVFSD